MGWRAEDCSYATGLMRFRPAAAGNTPDRRVIAASRSKESEKESMTQKGAFRLLAYALTLLHRKDIALVDDKPLRVRLKADVLRHDVEVVAGTLRLRR